ncbi:MAG TPA: PKD domain-containing protein [Thermoplasmata archaeon]|nr:PKD domain-containing protein [Thermoplasmata archaeon]
MRSIPVSAGPDFGLFDPGNRLAYFSHSDSNDVTILSGSAIVATVTTDPGPTALALDPKNGLVYVADGSSNNVSVLSNTTLIASIPVGGQPGAIVFDAAHGSMDVANYNSSTVSVIVGTRVVATATVGPGPSAEAFDSRNGWVYVADSSSRNLTVLNGSTAVATIVNLSGTPFYVTFDPFNGLIMASTANSAPTFVDVIDGLTRIASVPVWGDPVPAAIDPRNGWAYFATLYGQGNVTVLNDTHIQVTIGVGNTSTSLVTPLFDPDNGYLYVPHTDDFGGGRYVTVINRTFVAATLTVGGGPTGEVYDPFTGWIYVADFGNGVGTAISVISTLLAEGPVSAIAAGSPPHSLEVGQRVELNATLWGIGDGTDTATYASVPPNGLGCDPSVNFTLGDHLGTSLLVCTPTGAGTYSVTLTVTDGLGRSVSSSIRLVSSPGPLASVRLPRGSYDVGQTLVLTATGSQGSGGYAFEWFGIPTGCPTSGASIACSLTVFGRYSVTVQVTDSLGVATRSASVPFEVNPTLGLALPTVVGDPVVRNALTFSAAQSGGTAPFHWTWLFGDGSRDVVASPFHGYASAGRYGVIVWANDSANASVSEDLSVTIRGSGAAPTNGSAPPAWFGIPPTEGYLLLGTILLALLVLALWAVTKFRRKTMPPDPADPPARTPPRPSATPASVRSMP